MSHVSSPHPLTGMARRERWPSLPGSTQNTRTGIPKSFPPSWRYIRSCACNVVFTDRIRSTWLSRFASKTTITGNCGKVKEAIGKRKQAVSMRYTSMMLISRTPFNFTTHNGLKCSPANVSYSSLFRWKMKSMENVAACRECWVWKM